MPQLVSGYEYFCCVPVNKVVNFCIMTAVSRSSGAPEVKTVLESGRIPLLPFEEYLLRQRLGKLGIKQQELGKLLGEAMNQSSETWHDNAPADAINRESEQLVKEARQIGETLLNSVGVPYPGAGQEGATVGSIVGVRYAEDEEPTPVLLTGYVRQLPETADGGLSADLDVCTVRSPLGQALLGLTTGEATSYTANQRRISINVDFVQALTPESLHLPE